MPTPLFQAIIKNGNTPAEMLGWSNPAQLMAYLKPFIGVGLNFSTKKIYKSRNNDQNDRHWARMTWLIETGIAQNLGYATREEIHEAFISAFSTDRTGRLPKVKRSSAMNTKEFSEWEDQIDRELATMGVAIPDPGQEGIGDEVEITED